MAIKSDELFNMLTTVASFALLAIDGNGIIETATPQVRTIFKKNEGDVEGAPLLNLLPELSELSLQLYTPIQARGGINPMDDDKIEVSNCNYLEYLAAYEYLHGHYEVKTTVNGTSCQLELATYKILYDGNIMFTVIINDITKITLLKEAEQNALAQAYQAAAETKAKSDFLANMSHEIRTPMNGVLGMAELLKETPLQPNQIHYVRTIYNSGKTLLTILNDILDYSKIESGKMELETVDFNLEDLLDDCVSVFTLHSSDRKVPVSSLLQPKIPKIVLGDPTRLRQIIINLLSNAFKFTESGSVKLKATLVSQIDDKLTIKFEITDSGIGISEEQQQKLFRSFAQADASTTRKYGGTGLGLAICKQLAELMGGNIGVQSTQGVGSTFWFTVVVPAAPNQDIARAQEMNKEISGKTLFVVDDNVDFITVVNTLALSWGMNVYCAYSGASAIETLKALIAKGITIDVALLDVELPDMTGMKLSHQITTLSKHQPFPHLLTTSARNSALNINIENSRISLLLEKPISANHLRSSLVHALPGIHTHVRQREVTEQSTPDCSHLKILVAEDNRINQQVVMSMFKRLKVFPDLVDDGLQAVEAYKAAKPPYDVIFMDCEMPVLDGYEASQQIRLLEKGKPHKAKIFALSAHAMDEHVKKSLTYGMDAHISKPISINALRDALATMVNTLPKH